MQFPKIIYQDDYLLILDKPAGYVVNESATSHGNPTLQDFIAKNFDFETAKNAELRNGIVHRLDKPTSGIILVAKTKEIFDKLQKQFSDREVNKTYVALVHGKVEPSEGTIGAKVGRLPWNRMRFGVFEGGREAVTKYKVIKDFDGYSLVELYPKTGRTHQLRVHMKHTGHPIVGDFLYAGRKLFREDSKIWNRLWLHAKGIEFIHPVTGEKIKLEAPLPKELGLPGNV